MELEMEMSMDMAMEMEMADAPLEVDVVGQLVLRLGKQLVDLEERVIGRSQADKDAHAIGRLGPRVGVGRLAFPVIEQEVDLIEALSLPRREASERRGERHSAHATALEELVCVAICAPNARGR